MQVIAGAEIERDLGAEGPTGLASEPADYARCFAAAKLVAPRSFFNQLRFDRVQVEESCRQLHRAIKAQALSFLIAAHWTIVQAAQRHLTASPAEVSAALARATGQSSSPQEDMRRYLTVRHWSLGDLVYQAKLDVLAGKLRGRQRRQAGPAGPAGAIYATLSSESGHELAGRTVCRDGYMAFGCRGYDGSSVLSPSPEAILGQLTGKF
jgi:hypothetical protein